MPDYFRDQLTVGMPANEYVDIAPSIMIGWNENVFVPESVNVASGESGARRI
jgi:hypothetical protein